jgi:dephospho-CoA kinase
VFGEEILESDGQINRDLLGRIIFSNPDKRLKLNSITHPEIYKEIYWMLVWYFLQGYQFVMIESPLLFETRIWTKYVHKIIVVTCEDDLQLQRLMDRSNLRESECKARIASQLPNQEKCSKADYVIENSGNFADTERQVDEIYSSIRKSKMHWKIRFMVGLLSVCTSGLLGAIFWLLHRWRLYKRIHN